VDLKVKNYNDELSRWAENRERTGHEKCLLLIAQFVAILAEQLMAP